MPVSQPTRLAEPDLADLEVARDPVKRRHFMLSILSRHEAYCWLLVLVQGGQGLGCLEN